MTKMLTTVQAVREYARRAVAHLPIDQNRAEVRIYAGIVTTILALLLLEPVFYLMMVPESLISKVSLLAYPSHWIVVSVYTTAFLAVLPHLYCLYFKPEWLDHEWPRMAAGAASYGAGVMWLYLAALAYPLDYGYLWAAYLGRTAVAGLICLAMGYSVNAQQVRASAGG